MKTYRTAKSLHIVGQAYEVRWQLRRMVEQSANPHAPLFAQYAFAGPARIGHENGTIPFPARCS